MTTNNEADRGLEAFIRHTEDKLGYTLTDEQRAKLAAVYNRLGALEVHMHVDKYAREYYKVDDELSDLVDEFMSSPAKGRPVALDLGNLTEEARKALTDKVTTAIGEAGYSVNSPTSLSMDEYMKDMARQLTEAVDAEVVKDLDDRVLGHLVGLVNEEWSSRGHTPPKEDEQLNAPQYGKGGEADAITRAYAGGHGAYLGALLANGFTRDEAMSMVMFELNADLVRGIRGLD